MLRMLTIVRTSHQEAPNTGLASGCAALHSSGSLSKYIVLAFGIAEFSDFESSFEVFRISFQIRSFVLINRLATVQAVTRSFCKLELNPNG